MTSGIFGSDLVVGVARKGGRKLVFVASRDAAMDALQHLGASYGGLEVTIPAGEDGLSLDERYSPWRSGWDLAACLVRALVPSDERNSEQEGTWKPRVA